MILHRYRRWNSSETNWDESNRYVNPRIQRYTCISGFCSGLMKKLCSTKKRLLRRERSASVYFVPRTFLESGGAACIVCMWFLMRYFGRWILTKPPYSTANIYFRYNFSLIPFYLPFIIERLDWRYVKYIVQFLICKDIVFSNTRKEYCYHEFIWWVERGWRVSLTRV